MYDDVTLVVCLSQLSASCLHAHVHVCHTVICSKEKSKEKLTPRKRVHLSQLSPSCSHAYKETYKPYKETY